MTVKDFAKDVGISVDKLLSQLQEAGLQKNAEADPISDDEKGQLLEYLRKSHGRSDTSAEPHRVTLQRKKVSQLKVAAPGGRTRSRVNPKAAASAKTVTVEVRKKRTYVKAKDLVEEQERSEAEKKAQEAAAAAEEQARVEAEEKARAEAEAQAKAEAEEKAKAEAEEKAKAEAEEKAKAAAEEQTRVTQAAPPPPAEAPKPARNDKKPGKSDNRGRGRQDKSQLHVPGGKTGRRRKKKQPVSRRVIQTNGKHGFEKPTAPVIREVEIPESVSVAELAQRMTVKATDLIKAMMGMGMMATINQVIDQDTAAIIVEEMGHKYRLVKEGDREEQLLAPEAPAGEAVSRPPVVTIMGHVDHGKTSLLDYIRRARVAEGEAGGITQHIGAYQVPTSLGPVTFLDTPGHAAFTAMRARGAKVTDIVVLVVAADDGVMPQTEEAVKHARAAEVPIIVAVNKCDKPEADPDRVKQELSKLEVIPEDWGGDTQFVNVSAKTGNGVDDLLERIGLQAELLELNAPETGPATGVVIESSLDKGRGPVATILVQAGCLRKSDVLLAGFEVGRVRALINDLGENVDTALPSVPVEVLGLSGTPHAGDDATVVTDEKKAKEIAGLRQDKQRETKIAQQQKDKIQAMISQMGEGQAARLNVLIKADVQGSAEALAETLTAITNDEVEVEVRVIARGVGGITESDAILAQASNAMLVGFNVRADASARKVIESEDVDLRYYSVIYDVINDIKSAVSSMLAPEIRESIIGIAEVKDVFRSSQFGDIAGCIVSEGVVRRANPIRVLRDNVVIYEGELESLRRFKDDVNEVQSGTECGIGVKNYNDVKAGDQIEVFERIEVARTL